MPASRRGRAAGRVGRRGRGHHGDEGADVVAVGDVARLAAGPTWTPSGPGERAHGPYRSVLDGYRRVPGNQHRQSWPPEASERANCCVDPMPLRRPVVGTLARPTRRARSVSALASSATRPRWTTRPIFGHSPHSPRTGPVPLPPEGVDAEEGVDALEQRSGGRPSSHQVRKATDPALSVSGTRFMRPPAVTDRHAACRGCPHRRSTRESASHHDGTRSARPRYWP